MSYDTKALSPEAFAQYAKTHKGDPENGKKLFFDANGVGCAKCHKVDNDGGEIGPALTGVASKYDRVKLTEDILFPNKVILDGYSQTTVRTNDGVTLVGVVRGDTDSTLTILDANGTKTEIAKSNIKTRKDSHTSLMPEGLHTALKPEEFADLVSYLETLKEKKK
jgi:putative heme-binding domain-containing protein